MPPLANTMNTSKGMADFDVPTFDHNDLCPCSVRCTGSCPRMLLYVLDELFHVFQGVGANDLDGQRVVACEILSFT